MIIYPILLLRLSSVEALASILRHKGVNMDDVSDGTFPSLDEEASQRFVHFSPITNFIARNSLFHLWVKWFPIIIAKVFTSIYV
ncbi:hypothetical protein F4815DRAFT_459543 [Daldinia loculata]|nr:hypothetical protein F4815DRAFT_459543 [Daldinia loculata]